MFDNWLELGDEKEQESFKGWVMNPTIPGKPTTTFATACIGLLGVVQLAYGQGTVIFNNRVTGVTVLHVYGPGLCFVGNGTNDFPAGLVDWTPLAKLSGSGFLAQLLSAPGADQPESVLIGASSPATTFRTGAAAGCVSPLTATLVSVPADAPVATVQMVAWDNSSGNYPTWNLASVAWSSGLIVGGRSPKLNVYNIGGISNSPPFLTNLVSFNICYPEGTSTNLVQWNELFWVTNNLGTSQVTDPLGAGLNRRFYRATQ